MKLLILFASPRPEGNTAQLLEKITKRFDDSVEVARFDLYKMNLKSCIACLRCQKVSDALIASTTTTCRKFSTRPFKAI